MYSKLDMQPYNNADEILPRLWLGNRIASVDEQFITRNNIQVVINCTKDLPFSPHISIQYRIPLDDNLKEEEIHNMELWSRDIAYTIMKLYKAGRVILVHCMAGIQRSAASIALMLIAYRRMRGSEAIAFIKERRPIAFRNNVNFGRAIEYFDNEFHHAILPYSIIQISRLGGTP
jgi:predicted protein tyrosine phosphatase